MKKLYRNNNDKIFKGVLGGIAEYYEIDSSVIRLAFLATLLLTGIFPGLILYIVACIILPKDPNVNTYNFSNTTKNTYAEKPENTMEKTEGFLIKKPISSTPILETKIDDKIHEPNKPHWPITEKLDELRPVETKTNIEDILKENSARIDDIL